MNSTQIESWALRIIDIVKKGQPNEDFLVELKRDWIDKDKAARRIAGHANAARGENILWLIGVDEIQGVIGASLADLASWYPAVASCFNDLAPRMTPLNIPVDGVTVVALLFETDRAPFVVKNPAFGSKEGGAVELEVPWRENTSVRSARRSDLIRLLAPLELLPEIEILDVRLSVGTESNRLDVLTLTSKLYIFPKSRNRVVIPFHRCRVEFEIAGIPLWRASRIILDPESSTIQSTAHEIIVDDPGRISLLATTERPDVAEDCETRVSIYLLPTTAERPVVLTKTFPSLPYFTSLP